MGSALPKMEGEKGMSNSVLGKVLFVKERHYGANPAWGISNTESLSIETFMEAIPAEQVNVFYFDVLSQKFGRAIMDELLLDTCVGDRPDLVIFAPMGMAEIDPSRNVMNTITNVVGITVYMQRFDSIGAEGHRYTNSWFPFVSYIGFIDSTLAHLGYSHKPKAIQAFASFNARYFYNKKLPRDIDVSFIGGIPNFPRREEYIEFLKKNKVNIVAPGGVTSHKLTWEEYSDIINRSKISLNFCLQGNLSPQIKGRVFEVTSCRTCLIEDEGIETREFFDEGKDFIMVNSKEEMLEKILYYLKHDDERETIAESGYRKAIELYNSKNMWGYILSKMGFDIPQILATDRHYQKLYRKLESLC